jgi:AraC-like DNA-binding protein
MRNAFGDNDRLNWLQGEPGKGADIGASRPPIMRQEIPIEGNIGSAKLTLIDLPLGMSLAHSEYSFAPNASGALIPVMRVTSDFKSEVIIIWNLKNGRCVYDDTYLGARYHQDDRESIFIRTDRYDCAGFVDSGKKCTLYCIVAPIASMMPLIGDEVFSSLLSAASLSEAKSFSKKVIPQSVCSILHSSISHKIDGQAAVLHSQAKCLEYISQVMHHFGVGQVSTPRFSSSSQKRARELQAELVSLKGKVPTLDQLAVRYNVTADTLNNDFKKEFGQAIFSFITEQRLLEAYAVIEKSSVPIKIISENLGYSHPNHFLSAFRKKFGVTPSSLRKNKSAKLGGADT